MGDIERWLNEWVDAHDAPLDTQDDETLAVFDFIAELRSQIDAADHRPVMVASDLAVVDLEAPPMNDYEMMAVFVAALPLRQRVMLARGPAPDREGYACNVCEVLRDGGYATGGYRGGDRQAADWLLNWHGSDHLKCMAIYGAAAATIALDQEQQ